MEHWRNERYVAKKETAEETRGRKSKKKWAAGMIEVKDEDVLSSWIILDYYATTANAVAGIT